MWRIVGQIEKKRLPAVVGDESLCRLGLHVHAVVLCLEPLRLDRLSFPELEPVRKALVDEVVDLSADREASRAPDGGVISSIPARP